MGVPPCCAGLRSHQMRRDVKMGIRKRSKIFKNIQKHSKNDVETFENIQKYSKIFKNVQKYSNLLDADCAAKFSHRLPRLTQVLLPPRTLRAQITQRKFEALNPKF